MVRQARAMVADGQLGEIRLVQVEYVQGGRAMPGVSRSPWKDDAARGGPSLVMGDIGTHAHNLLRFIAGLDVAEVAAEVGTVVPTRTTHDYAGALLRMQNGARGSFWVTQAATAVENALRIRISGSMGTLEWQQEQPQLLSFKPAGAPAQIRTPNGPGTLPLSTHASRIVAGHPEAFTRPLPTCIPMPPKPLQRAVPVRQRTPLPCTSRLQRMACWACASWMR